jgi:hypothetical protein
MLRYSCGDVGAAWRLLLLLLLCQGALWAGVAVLPLRYVAAG